MISFLVLLALAPAPASPPSEAAISAFIAALPPGSSDKKTDPDLEAAQEAAETKYPKRKAEVAAIYATVRQCEDRAGADEVARSLRATALKMTDEELQSLTAFYSGPDYKRFSELQDAREAHALSAAESAERSAIVQRYPLEKFGKATLELANSFEGKDAFFAALTSCEEARDAALGRLDSAK